MSKWIIDVNDDFDTDILFQNWMDHEIISSAEEYKPKSSAEEACELVRRIVFPDVEGGMTTEEIYECFGKHVFFDVLELPYPKVRQMYDEWKQKTGIRGGDEEYDAKRKEALSMAIKSLEKENADGCTGCAFESVEEWQMPCMKCKRNCKDYWRVKEMTNQEAIKWLNEAEILDLTSGNTKDRQAIDAAIEALEKQIPKKPIYIDKNKEFDGNWKKVCPLCGRILIERITTSEKSYPRHYNYTGHCLCGQAIDWEEE